MRIALIFDRARENTSGIYFERALQRLGLDVTHCWLREAARIPTGFDVYLRIDHGDYVDDLPRHLRPAAFYMIDTHLAGPLTKMRRIVAHYDVLFCAQHNARRWFPRAVWVPAAYDVELHSDAAKATQQFDVGFVGGRGRLIRKFYLQEIRERYPRSYVGWAPHTRIGAIYGASKIVFNYAIANDLNMRVFEALGAGRCLLTNALSDNGLEELFHDREHLVVYRSPEECWRLLDYYLTHDEDREAIARQGHALARSRHTYDHRVRMMLQVLHERLGVSVPQLEESACAS